MYKPQYSGSWKANETEVTDWLDDNAEFQASNGET